MITGGTQTFRRVVNLGDYNTKEAKAEIHFSMEGDVRGLDAVVQEAMAVAVNTVAVQLATVVKIAETPVSTIATPHSAAPAPTEAPAVSEEASADPLAPTPTRARRRTKAEMEAAAAEEVPPAAAAAEEVPQETPEAPIDSDFSPLAAPVTDAELQTACERKNLTLKDSVKIRQLIARYSHESLATVPQERREEFLVALEALS